MLPPNYIVVPLKEKNRASISTCELQQILFFLFKSNEQYTNKGKTWFTLKEPQFFLLPKNNRFQIEFRNE